MSKASKYSMEWVSEQITEVGKKNGLVNVFPVSYFRKISLDLNNELKVKESELMIHEEPVKVEVE